MDQTKLQSVLESLLFVSGEPISFAKLAKICDAPKAEVEKAVDELALDFEKGGGLRIVRKGDRVQMATAPDNSAYVNQLISGEMSTELSKSALETIAIIAYRGSITRPQIEAIRGVNCSYVLRGLLVRGLVDRNENPESRGYLYGISFQFLKHMGISRLEDLPDWINLSKNDKIESALQAQIIPESGKESSNI